MGIQIDVNISRKENPFFKESRICLISHCLKIRKKVTFSVIFKRVKITTAKFLRAYHCYDV